jgi:hypothetical protein
MIMKRIKFLFLSVAVLLATNSFGQEETGTGPNLSIGAEVALPVGDLGDSHKLGLGGSLKAAFPVATDAFVTVSGGYISFSGKSVAFGGQSIKVPALNAIPLKAGFQYRFPGGFYLEPQLGYTIFSVKDADSDGAFTYAFNVGYLINKALDISTRYEAASKEGSTISHVGFRLAYNFSL